jgi:hypothetical protein
MMLGNLSSTVPRKGRRVRSERQGSLGYKLSFRWQREKETVLYTDNKGNEFSSYIRKFRVEQLQCHI